MSQFIGLHGYNRGTAVVVVVLSVLLFGMTALLCFNKTARQLAKSCFDPTRRFNRPQHQLRAVYSVVASTSAFRNIYYQD